MKYYEVTQLVEVNYAIAVEDGKDVYDAINEVDFYVDVNGDYVDPEYYSDALSSSVLQVSELTH